MGRHAKPRNHNTTKHIAVGASVLLGGSVVPVTLAGSAQAATVDQWDRIAACESGDKNIPGSGRWNLPGGDADSTGGLQIQTRTWLDFGGQQYAPQAYQASKQQQIEIAEKILARQGAGAWVCNNPGHGIATGALGSGTGASYLNGGPKPYAPASPTAPSQRAASDKAAAEVLRLVNAERAKAGLGALVLDEALNGYAYDWATTQAHDGVMKHSDLDFAGSPRGENVAAGQGSAEEVVADWMASEGHRKNILGSGFTKMGLGLHDDGKPYWAQVFAGGVSASPKPSAPVEPEDASDGTYVVKKGDWLMKITRDLKLGDDWKPLYEINKKVIGSNPDRIYPGQKLTLPGHEPLEDPELRPESVPKPKPSGWTLPVQGRIGDSLIVNGSCISRSCGGHSGLDISAPQGTPVVSAGAGLVVSVNASGAAYGNHVVVKHSDGYYTLYAHLSAITVRIGQSVTAGQQVGNVGSTGASSGPHLHFEVRTHPTDFGVGVFIGPMGWLRSHGVSI